MKMMSYKEARDLMSEVQVEQNIESFFKVTELKNVTIDALEKQIPKKPKNYHGDDYPKWVCPRCDKDAYYSHVPWTIQFCPECGQAIDWSDVK